MGWFKKTSEAKIDQIHEDQVKIRERLYSLEEKIGIYEYAKAENIAASQTLSTDVALLREAIEGWDPTTSLENAFEKIKFSMRRVK